MDSLLQDFSNICIDVCLYSCTIYIAFLFEAVVSTKHTHNKLGYVTVRFQVQYLHEFSVILLLCRHFITIYPALLLVVEVHVDCACSFHTFEVGQNTTMFYAQLKSFSRDHRIKM